ncbi:MAG: hypothetical protein H0V17_13755 [Deltaproteobacteria bacterium]|nr:hypothetical protein [Deltaproteobacteria bacterium]
MMTRSFVGMLCLLIATGCGDAKGKEAPQLRPAAVVPTTNPTVEPKLDPAQKPDAKIKDVTKGDKQDKDWVPNEHKAGLARWKDTGVYVDGKPVGFLNWGELPIGLKPTWVKDKVSDRKRPGTNDPGWKWSQQRFYRFTDYFKAVGIDIRKVKEVHLYGPKMSQTLIASGADLQGPLANEFMFRFGTNTGGKPIPHAPGNFGNGKTADKITAVMVYQTKKPPTLVRNEGLELDGQLQTGVPYYGEPIRGGIRVYLDDKLAAIIKRQELDAKKATTGKDGELTFKLTDVFAAQGVDAKKVVEIWMIRDERREEKIPGSELPTLTFSANAQAHGGVLVGDKKYRANAIALHTRPVADAEIPKPTEWDD